MPTKRRYELSDAQWARLEPRLPPEKPGRPNDDHRRILNGILWILNSVARPAAALWSGGHGVEPVLPLAGVWQHVLEALQADAQGRVGWELHFLDSTVVPACRRGAQNRPRVRHRGRGAGPIAWRLHDPLALRGLRQACYLHGDQVHDTRQVSALISRGAIRRIGRGRLRPAKMVGDKAYSSRSIRLALRKRGIIPVIPTKSGVSPASIARHTGNVTSSSA